MYSLSQLEFGPYPLVAARFYHENCYFDSFFATSSETSSFIACQVRSIKWNRVAIRRKLRPQRRWKQR